MRATASRSRVRGSTWRTEKFFYSTIGSAIEQTIVQTGSGVQAMAVGDGDVQTRTYPGDVGLYKSGGWEIVDEAALTQNAQRIGEEATALLTAPQCPSGTSTSSWAVRRSRCRFTNRAAIPPSSTA